MLRLQRPEDARLQRHAIESVNARLRKIIKTRGHFPSDDAATKPLLGSAFYPVLAHRLAASLHAYSPHSVTLMQWRFASLAVIN